MGTDRWPETSMPCKCGNGTFVITHCEPDHNFVKDHQEWYECQIKCSVCICHYEVASGLNKQSLFLKDKRSGQSECLFNKDSR